MKRKKRKDETTEKKKGKEKRRNQITIYSGFSQFLRLPKTYQNEVHKRRKKRKKKNKKQDNYYCTTRFTPCFPVLHICRTSEDHPSMLVDDIGDNGQVIRETRTLFAGVDSSNTKKRQRQQGPLFTAGAVTDPLPLLLPLLMMVIVVTTVVERLHKRLYPTLVNSVRRGHKC